MIMEMILERKWYTERSTVGELSIDGVFECYTLEDHVRKDGVKVWGETAIPAGEYEVVVSFSPRFGKDMPLLLDVKNYAGVRIHTGNKPEDTEGCILVGVTHPRADWVGESGLAFASLFPKILDARKLGRILINVKDTDGLA